MNIAILTYLDPGSGSMIAQAVIGAIAAVGVTLKLFWHRILRILGLKKTPKPDLTDDGTPKAE